ncbi:hypothetical protein NDU88_004871 [Pleurodeles waltl]|uniref:Uncharacterized protein n=1 Tax=Pleurodeles waltl TaxID=8319 RepID=A0AAV7UHL1_PLEWA|nr:hypothetical protein NDU88_004871 [Pleurodeles waltl]
MQLIARYYLNRQQFTDLIRGIVLFSMVMADKRITEAMRLLHEAGRFDLLVGSEAAAGTAPQVSVQAATVVVACSPP